MFFRKIKFNTNNIKVRQIKINGMLLLEYYSDINQKRKHYNLFPLSKHKKEFLKYSTVFYLKFNRSENWAFHSLQHWIDIADCMNAYCYIVCDKEELELEIYKRINFKTKNFVIIKSHENELIKLAQKLVHSKWVYAAASHMITFYHAQKNGINAFWNIDADDTMFCLNSLMVKEIMKHAEKYAQQNNIENFSLDMWRSRSNGVHWSFGVTYTQLQRDYMAIFDEFKNINWQQDYSFYNVPLNIDWFFNYLTEYRNVRTASFYVDNLYFIHWGDFLINVLGGSLTKWQNGYLLHPILLNCNDSINGKVQISNDCICLDVDLNESECQNFMTSRLFNYDTSVRK